MKKNLFILALLAAFAATGCTEADNYAGGDSKSPQVTIYADDDAKTYQVGFRAVPNTAVEAVYILTETSFAREEAMAADGEEAYLQYVRDNGTLYQGQEPIDYLANPDNNSTSDKAYVADDNLLGYITTTIVVDGKGGKSNVYTIDTDCYSTALTLSNFRSNKMGDWVDVKNIIVAETAFNPEGNVGIGWLCQIPNTDIYCIPGIWYYAMGKDYDLMGSENIVFRMDEEGAVKGLVSTTIMSGFDDGVNGEWGFSYDGDPDYCSFENQNGVYVLEGYLLYGENVAMTEPEDDAVEPEPITMQFIWMDVPETPEEPENPGEGGEGGEGTEGDGTEGDGTEGDGTEGDGTEGDGTEGDGTEGDGTEGEGTEGDGTEGDENTEGNN